MTRNARPTAIAPPRIEASPNETDAPGATAADCPMDALLQRADRCSADAFACGALQPIRTEQTWLDAEGLRFSVRWVSSLALKDRARVDTVIRRRPDFNPFLPPEPALTVAAIGEHHLVVLNKFPVIERHLLIVTRAFEPQTAALSDSDLLALAKVLRAHGGLGFYNGGRIAGASQAHKHLQWVPSTAAALTPFVPRSCLDRPGYAVCNPALPWAHAFVGLEEHAWRDDTAAGQNLRAALQTACAALSMPARAQPMPDYNLLVSRECLLLVPRTQEKWQDVSINSLAYAGSLFVRDHAQIERLRAAGALAVLAAVGRPG